MAIETLEEVLGQWDTISSLNTSFDIYGKTIEIIKNDNHSSVRVGNIALDYSPSRLREDPAGYIAEQEEAIRALIDWSGDALKEDRETLAMCAEIAIDGERGESFFPPMLMNAYKRFMRTILSVNTIIKHRTTLGGYLKAGAESFEEICNGYQVIARITEEGLEFLRNTQFDVNNCIELTERLGQNLRYLSERAHTLAEGLHRSYNFYYPSH